MNNALTISCVDSIAILFMFYLKIFLRCCNDKTGSTRLQEFGRPFALGLKVWYLRAYSHFIPMKTPCHRNSRARKSNKVLIRSQ
jgi:hypothetical protein